MRPRRLIAPLLFAALLVAAGCGGSGDDGQTTATTAPPTGQQLSDEIASFATYRFKAEALSWIGSFTTPRAPVTLVSVVGTQPPYPMAEYESATRFFEQLADQKLQVPVVFPKDGNLKLTWEAAHNPAKRRYLLFLPVETAKQLGDVPAFTDYNLKDPEAGTVSVLADQSAKGNLPGVAVERNRQSTYVELCQQTIRVETPEATRQRIGELAPSFDWNKKKHRDKIFQVGQEHFCNSLGLAMAFARSKIAYEVYEGFAGALTMDALGEQFAGKYYVVPRDLYNAMAA